MLRKWRAIVVWAIVFALLVGSVVAAMHAIDMNDEEQIELWQSEYEIAQGIYWAAIYDLDRQIGENERLAAQAENELLGLDRQKADYEAEITDLEAEIEYYQDRAENYQASNEQLLNEREKLEYYLNYRKEQNENSLLMAIDPYQVNAYEIYLRVDSGYEILPENTYQNIDRTAELLQTYRLLVGKTNFYDQMISDLKLNTEVRYLTEVISVSNYNTNSLCIRVISDRAAWAKMVAEYISDAILAEHSHVKAAIADHEITKYNTAEYSVVDLNIYTKQQNHIQEALHYEDSIRDVNTTILNNEAAIREIHADIRELRTQIEDLKAKIANLPLEKQALEDEIATIRDANYALRQEQLGLYERPEPEYEGYTADGLVIDFAKFAVIGGVVGALLAAVWFVVAGVMSNKVLSAEQICEALQCECYGFWPRAKRKVFGFVDRWIGRLAGNPSVSMTKESATDLVLSNARIACKGKKKILLCGGASQETIDAIARAMKEQLPGVEVICGRTVDSDPAVVRGVAECDAVILVEQLDRSGLHAAMQLEKRAKAMDKPILGVVLH